METNEHEVIIESVAKRKIQLNDQEVAEFRQRENETKDRLEQRRLQAVRSYVAPSPKLPRMCLQ